MAPRQFARLSVEGRYGRKGYTTRRSWRCRSTPSGAHNDIEAIGKAIKLNRTPALVPGHSVARSDARNEVRAFQCIALRSDNDDGAGPRARIEVIENKSIRERPGEKVKFG